SEQLTRSRTCESFRRKLLRWYDAHRRDLPWRKTKDPYRIWISEIMLQQTRVGAVLEHYRRFLDRFPTVDVLARARSQSVLAAWSGLGYYRRARNLHAAAKVIAVDRGGVFPQTAEELRQLPGIGRYTAAAIASIAFGEQAAVVDGNVERVLQRITGTQELSNRELWNLAEGLLSPKRPADFNQAMMELGAVVCLPREPKCLVCPVLDFCHARGSQARGRKEIRKAQPVAYVLSRQNGSVWLVQRSKDVSLMAGMWELPLLEGHVQESPAARFKHSILDTNYDVAVHELDGTVGNGHWISHSRLRSLALTGLTRKVLRHFNLL
ncbi:MAG TPA: A/G-specific adenine glycosylase, partial [Terriglobales bacterium]|nr:A/G-specific adenine glycosylase [Terriglobales bacterium]